MVASDRMLRRLCWALIAFTVATALFTVTLSSNVFSSPVPDDAPFVERLLAFRASDQQVYGLLLVSSVVTSGVFLIGALMGPALRRFAGEHPAAGLMSAVFVIGGAIGIVSQLVNIAVAQVATFTYCDCGLLETEVIAQDYALALGWTTQTWLNLGGVTLVGIAAGIAGRVVEISREWSMISYLIAFGALVAVGMRIFQLWELSSLLIGVVAGLLVPIWAYLITRVLSTSTETSGSDAAPEPAAG